MKKRIPHLPDLFTPPIPQENDEYICNGLFCFNISLMNHDIDNGLCDFTQDQTPVSIWSGFGRKTLKDEYIEAADLSRPVIIVEISPDRILLNSIKASDWHMRGYNLLDGHHRIEKATRQDIEFLDAYILPMESHIRYMYSGFDVYRNYWDDKWKTLLADSKRF